MEDNSDSIGIFQAIFVIGFLAYVSAFGSVQFEWIDGNNATYSALIGLAVSLTATNLFAQLELSSALVQGSWIIIGLVGILKHNSAKTPCSAEISSRSHSRDLA